MAFHWLNPCQERRGIFFLPSRLCYHHMAWEFCLLVSWLYLIEVSVYQFFTLVKHLSTYQVKVHPNAGTSLVAQWLRVCLPMQGTQVRALVWEDPTCRRAARPVSHNYWACASGACAPQQERPRQWEARTLRWRVAPALRNWRQPSHRNEDPTQPNK